MHDKKKIEVKKRKTLEERDREDQELFGWKGGLVYRRNLDLDQYLEEKEE